ncbi:MAG: hypothetical protein KAH72_03085 [Flavobacteriaceae bacterium]|nr:hypothetical protein [Flavobacteriaceae bacterium]
MKTNKRTEIKIVLVWAAAILIVSLLLKTIEGYEQIINFLIIAGAINVSIFLNGTNNLSCKPENNKIKC